MIICPGQGFVFVHIPKCAGSSIRRQILQVDPDHIELARSGTHPDLGQIDFGHIPLDQLRVHFPDHYAQIRALDSFAVVRDPLARFGSALRQVLWQYEQRPMTLIPPAELRETTLRILDQVAAEIDAPSAPFIFFMRQDRFILDGEDQVLRNLIPLDLVPDFIGYISRRTGVPMETEARANQNVDLRVKGGFGTLAYKVNDRLRSVLPVNVHTRLKDTALRVLATKKSAAEASGLLDMPELRAFVQDHYARDAAIYAAVSARKVALAQDLAQGHLPITEIPA
ncbi:hypothetical protein V8J82_23340 [Gymnodinialimonas sp. 2305UL16-5]|uniref:hypothetical protein n=1 Tax=Gymnodinialimonas mytili TaxID=3126503 RepID=UPI0030A5F33B